VKRKAINRIGLAGAACGAFTLLNGCIAYGPCGPVYVWNLFGIPSRSSTNQSPLIGHYYRGNRGDDNVYLELLANGEYKAEWQGYSGVNGIAQGTWSVTNQTVILSPSKETQMVKGYLRELHIIEHRDQQPVLVPDIRSSYYLKWGPDEYAAFHKK